jgi:hypothetical protein
MSELKCPFCQQKLRKIHPTYVICDNCRITGEDKLWQELIRTRKALDVAVDALKSADEYYMYCAKKKTLQNNAGLVAFGMDNTITKALEQITELEQKDVK